MRRSLYCWVLALCLPCGCKHESTITTRSSCFDLCLDASAHVDVDGEIGVASELRDGFDKARSGLVACTAVASALTQFVQSMVEQKGATPSGLSYKGGGLYTMQVNAETQVQVRFYLPAATSFGEAGSVIEFNVFDPTNYFASLGVKTEVSASLSGISTKLSFTFSSLGPGAELLGISPGASSPLPIDVSSFSNRLGRVMIGAEVGVNQSSEKAKVAFSLLPEPSAVAALANQSVKLTVKDFSAQGLEFAQTILLDSVDLKLQNPGSTLDGLLHASAIGADFGFQIRLSYDASAQGSITLGCLGVEL